MSVIKTSTRHCFEKNPQAADNDLLLLPIGKDVSAAFNVDRLRF